jgi:hypothetical protein
MGRCGDGPVAVRGGRPLRAAMPVEQKNMKIRSRLG